MIKFLLVFIFAYTAGSINFSIILFKILKLEDPRTKFSGNAGVSNVYRQAGKFWATAVLLLDTGRAVGIALLSTEFLLPQYITLAGFGLILGNSYPCFHQFRGGKGVANYLGFTAVLAPVYAGLSAIVWVAVYGIIRIPFIASFFMISTLASGTILTGNNNLISITGTLSTAILIFYNHRKNIINHLKNDK